MTANELERIALRLSNSSWCRYWLNYNASENPRKMAIQILEADFGIWRPQRVIDLERLGFVPSGGRWVYIIDRTNEDGTPYFGVI